MIAQKQIKSWIPTAEYIFVKHMLVGNKESDESGCADSASSTRSTSGTSSASGTRSAASTSSAASTNSTDTADTADNKDPIDITELVTALKSLPHVYIGSPKKTLQLRAELVEQTHSHQVECSDPYDSIMEMIHGEAGDAILIQQKLLTKSDHADLDFCHYLWHELGHYFAIKNECPGNNLHRFCDFDFPDEREKQEGYWFWSEFIAEAISNYVDEQHCRIDNADLYHPELITWEPEQWWGLSYTLADFLNMTFANNEYRIDEAALGMYFATLLTDDATKRYVEAAENGKLKDYNWGTGELEVIAPEDIDPTCICSSIPYRYEEQLLDMKGLLEQQLKKEKFWEIDENFLEEIGNCILQMMNKKMHILAAEMEEKVSKEMGTEKPF